MQTTSVGSNKTTVVYGEENKDAHRNPFSVCDTSGSGNGADDGRVHMTSTGKQGVERSSMLLVDPPAQGTVSASSSSSSN